MSRLQEEIKQTKPFHNLRHEVFVSIARTAAVLNHAFEHELKRHGITLTQYNVLRILRGAGPKGLCRYEISNRLITQVPDVSRLLDRMTKAGLATRERDSSDRRLVAACITPAGLAMLATLDAPTEALTADRLQHMSEEQLAALRDLLDVARGAM